MVISPRMEGALRRIGLAIDPANLCRVANMIH
jgi:hypothetical protein